MDQGHLEQAMHWSLLDPFQRRRSRAELLSISGNFAAVLCAVTTYCKLSGLTRVPGVFGRRAPPFRIYRRSLSVDATALLRTVCTYLHVIRRLDVTAIIASGLRSRREGPGREAQELKAA